MATNFEPGTRCWIPDKDEGWLGVEVKDLSHDNGKYQLRLVSEDGERSVVLEVPSLEEGTEGLPLPRNQIETVEDLTELSHLNEPSVLNAIRTRYAQLSIYTYSGIVLIAINPFQRNDELYSQHRIQRYAFKRRGEEEPHLFAIAEEAYRCMITERQNQSIVVSGESGAGKTVSAKYIMRYFASVESDEKQHDMSETEKQILATNPIMEAFGNAKTTRNDNSSRFGKYLEILFDKDVVICGARIRTYLLERSRLVFQPHTERNYHIFYQIMAGLDPDTKKELGLSAVGDFFYLNQGGVPTIDEVDDANEFRDTCEALALVGIGGVQQREIFKILAGLLHIGNINIQRTRSNAILAADEPNVVIACKMLGLNAEEFARWIVKKQITTRSEKIISNLNYDQAVVARDSVAKYIYASLFDWLVQFINADLCTPELEARVSTFIGVLDIYGFEHFEKNSFEQFCINYANEKLQQEFTQHVFKLEQEEYVREEIEWSFIDFSDNQPCIDVIEGKLGVLDLLDEEARLPSGSDQQWIDKMYQSLLKTPTDDVFHKPRFSNNRFIISHYALDVTYESQGFIEKNRDTVSDGQLDTLKGTTNSLLADVLETVDRAAEKLAQNSKANRRLGMMRKPTLGNIFKSSLIDLMKTINSTNAHYIRCIKPNEEKRAWEFDPLMVLSQLRACGVLETIKISCAGFPSRSAYMDFLVNFAVLLPSGEREKFVRGEASEKEAKEATRKLLSQEIQDDHKYQAGKTKVFFKAGILGYLEKLRSHKIKESAIVIQKYMRGHQVREQYLEAVASLHSLQALLRGYLTRHRLQKQVEKESATTIQSLLRGYVARKHYNEVMVSVVAFQALLRGAYVRSDITKHLRLASAILIQSALRGFAIRKDYFHTVRAATIIETCCRRLIAKKKYTKLRAEAKSLNRMKEVQYSLENKVIELTQNLASKVEENGKLVSQIEQLQKNLKHTQTVEEDLKKREADINSQLDSKTSEHQQAVALLTADIAHFKKEYEEARAKVDEMTKSQTKLKDELRQNLTDLKTAQDALESSKQENETLHESTERLQKELDDLKKQLTTATVVNGRSGGFGSASSSPLHRNLAGSPTTGTFEPRPASIFAPTTKEENSLEAINTELWTLLKDAKTLHKEVVDGLLRGLRLPAASVASELTRKEVLFPARIIIIILSDMWRLGLTSESETFLGEVLSVIQNIVGSLKEDDVIAHGAFWLTNTHELYSFVAYAQSTILANDAISKDMTDSEYDEYLKLVAVVKEDFESLSYNIYNMWMKKMLKDLEKKCISAVVLAQALPGFVAPDSPSPLITKMFHNEPKYKMDDVLTFFNTVYWSMKAYFVEPQVINEVIIELLKFVDALCFNDLIMRRNFLSWKRGLQLNYNVTRLEEWCKAHDIQEGSTYLAHLLQVSKLLQLRKNTPDDIEIIYEICYALRPVQIQKLISQYHVADYETPISPAVTKALADKVKKSGGSTDFFEPLNAEGHFDDPFRHVELRPFHRVEAYVPAWLNVPVIRRIVELVTKNATIQEALQHQQMLKEEEREGDLALDGRLEIETEN
ncbi:DEKNAAC100709 [Brettanomyces naardenensis]|uniref:DEKNAAC100709 n=1 Tax=Brettanomyces naardenensis TaxID=13370 RepID=A0A448YES5_BRENA|nr:DEKNAAC100709 [Brettanomyces naardenensis]